MRKSIAFLALALSATVAHAEVKTDADAKMQYDVPAGFTATQSGRVMVVGEPKNEIAFFLATSGEKDLEQAVAEIDKIVAPFIKDIKPLDDKKPEVGKTYNGLKGITMKGTGTFEGKPVNVTLRIIQSPNGKFFIVAGAYLTEKKEQLKDTFNKFYTSVKGAG